MTETPEFLRRRCPWAKPHDLQLPHPLPPDSTMPGRVRMEKVSVKCVFVGGPEAAQKSSLSVDHTGDMFSVLLRVVERAEMG